MVNSKPYKVKVNREQIWWFELMILLCSRYGSKL